MKNLVFGSPEWCTRLNEILTRRSLLRLAKHSETARTAFILRYQKAIKVYLKELLVREKEARDGEEATRIAEGIYDAVLAKLRRELAKGWASSDHNARPDKDHKKAKRRFRDDLIAWIHEAHFQHLKPAPAVFDRVLRDELLRKTWNKLEEYEQNYPDKVCYRLLRLREEFPKEKPEPFRALLAEATGQDFELAAVRQQLRRAYNRFGWLLLEEVTHLVGTAEPDLLRQKFEELQLVCYAAKSSRCRRYLSLATESQG